MKTNSKEDLNEVVEKLKKFKMDYNVDFPKPKVVIGINQDNETIPMFTKGNFSVVIGKPKSKKSTFISLVAAAYLNGKKGLFNMSSETENGKILWIDTEQNDYHLSVFMKNIFRIIPNCQSRLNTYRFRSMKPADRFTNVKYLVEYYTSKGTELIVLDGIADFLSLGYNDETEAINISSYLLEATEKYNCHIITVLHQNKGNHLAKGQLGSYINQKAESVLSVYKENSGGDVSVVSPQMTRNMDFRRFSICFENNIPTINANYVEKSTKGGIDFSRFSNEVHMEFLTNLGMKLNIEWILRNVILKAMQEPNSVLAGGCSENRSIAWLNYLLEHEMLIQNKSKQNAPYKINI